MVLSVLISCKSKQIVTEKHLIDNNTVLKISFDANKKGHFTKRKLKKKTGKLESENIERERSEIVYDKERGQVLMVKYPKGSYGYRYCGIQFIKTLPEAHEYYLDYYIKLKDGFDYVLGGKLPGLTSGGEKFTGGNHPVKGEGWSARYVWRKAGSLEIYFYHMGMKGKWGDSILLDIKLQPGKWYRLTQHIKLNDDNNFNGVLEVWVNGKKQLNKRNVRYRVAPLGMIDSFAFSTFHGGNSPKSAPNVDSYIYFDDIQITKKKPEGLQ